MYQNERIYVTMHERTFTLSASRSMIENGGIENIISNYAGSPSSFFPSKSKVYNLDEPYHRAVQLPEQKPMLLEYKSRNNQINQKTHSFFNYNPLDYLKNLNYSKNGYSKNTAGDYFHAENFLHIYRPDTQFIDDADEVKEFVKEAFRKTTGEELPREIKITVCNEEKFRLLHEANGGRWSKGIQGFSVHLTKGIVIKQNNLDVVMLVMGHELGHVLSHCLSNPHDEEAKAFAFELAWMKTIKRHNIANLAENINIDFSPANNGLHDVAFNFVKSMVKAGKEAIDVFKGLIRGDIGMEFSL